jgi:hypothetical protein
MFIYEYFSMTNLEYEFISLHRDVGETELKQGRELRHGGHLSYVDSAAVRAAKHGRILIIEGIEKAERGIMPVSYNHSHFIFSHDRKGSEQSARKPRNVRFGPYMAALFHKRFSYL